MITEKYSTDLVKTKYVDDSKITDHYAIIPTGQGFENYDKLKDLYKEVYKVIVKRFLAIFYPPAEYNKISITIDVDNEKFYTSGKVCTNLGYLEILKPIKKERKKSTNEEKDVENLKENEEEQENNLEILASLKKGQEIEISNYITKESETTPPTRYNSGSLILAMKNAGKYIEDEALREQIKGAGIGTSATRQGIIEKLEKIRYITINSKTQRYRNDNRRKRYCRNSAKNNWILPIERLQFPSHRAFYPKICGRNNFVRCFKTVPF